MTKCIDGVAVELAVRKDWTRGRLGELVNLGCAEGWLGGDPVETGDPDRIPAAGVASTSPMHLLGDRLALSSVELDVLWLLVCVELDPGLARGAQQLVSPGMHQLNVQIVERLAACDGTALDRLQRAGLIETCSDPRLPLYRRPIRACDRVVELARGRLALDRELADLATLTPASDGREPDQEVPAELAHAIAAAAPVFIVASGASGSGRATLLRHAIATSGRSTLAVQCAALASDEATLTRQLRAIARECRLHDAWPLLLDIDGLIDRVGVIERELLRGCDGPALATSHDSCTWPVSRTLISIAVGHADEPRRAAMWQRALPEAAPEVVRRCAARYTISRGLLHRTAAAARAMASGHDAVSVDDVHAALRVQLEHRLLGLARRIETRQTWDDLVLPVDQFDLLTELVARVRHRRQVLDTWGFADKVGRGLGVSALLSGPPGTGKTMIAGLVARELGLDLYQVDLSRVVSKYIGETEKQLSALFEAAESGHAILLFDEAESLFGKRTDVRSSNDRYANLEVNYLLQRMEAFAGISLLTTNHETAIDPAFQRRLAFHIRVPMPDRAERELLWHTMMPDRAARAGDLGAARLASEFVMSGGYIRNAVLRAAYFAADAGEAIGQRHLLRAARAEYDAMGKLAV